MRVGEEGFSTGADGIVSGVGFFCKRRRRTRSSHMLANPRTTIAPTSYSSHFQPFCRRIVRKGDGGGSAPDSAHFSSSIGTKT